MSKYGPQHRRTEKRAEKAQRALAGTGSHEVARPEDCDSVERFPYEPTETTRVIVEMGFRLGETAYFAIMHDIWSDGTWHNVTRIDCKHKHIHQHKFTRQGELADSPVSLVALHSESDVGKHYTRCYNMVFENIDENERAWRNV